MHEGPARRHAERPGAHRIIDQSDHRGDVVAGRRSLVEPTFTHHVRAQRAVSDESSRVRTLRQPIDRVVVLGVRLPVPCQPVENRIARNVLDALHHLGERRAVLGTTRRERDSAVAHDDARHPVPTARGADRIPGELRIEVRVDVDEARRDEPTLGIDLTSTRAVDPAVVQSDDLGDPVGLDADVRTSRRSARAVDDGAVTNDDVVVHAASNEFA